MNADEEIGAFLVAQNVIAANLVFYGALPDELPDKCVAIVPRPGRKPGKKFGRAAIAYHYPRFSVLVRGDVQDYQSGYDIALAVEAKCGEVQAQTIGGGAAIYHALEPTPPLYKGEDKSRRPVFDVMLDPERELP